MAGMEELCRLSFGAASGSGVDWTAALECEAALAPVASEDEYQRLTSLFWSSLREVKQQWPWLAESYEELRDLEALLRQVSTYSPEFARIVSALNWQFYQNEEVLAKLAAFEALYARCLALRQRLTHWEALRHSAVLSGVLSLLEEAECPPFQSSLPELPPLPPGLPSSAALRSRARRLNADASPFIPSSCPRRLPRRSPPPAPLTPSPTPPPRRPSLPLYQRRAKPPTPPAVAQRSGTVRKRTVVYQRRLVERQQQRPPPQPLLPSPGLQPLLQRNVEPPRPPLKVTWVGSVAVPLMSGALPFPVQGTPVPYCYPPPTRRFQDRKRLIYCA